jgi:hypothetical protein
MIRTAVYTGESAYAKAAQTYATEMAQRFSARLKVVRIRNTGENPDGVPGGGSARELARRTQQDILAAAAAQRANVGAAVAN